jgi:Ni/Fe-hydrogenase subunit HybB-like protein
MSDRGEDPEKTPSTTEEEQKEEAEILAQGTLRTGVVSIVALLLLVLGLMQATGMADPFPFGSDWTVEWLVFVLLAVVLVGIELWSWRSEPE